MSLRKIIAAATVFVGLSACNTLLDNDGKSLISHAPSSTHSIQSSLKTNSKKDRVNAEVVTKPPRQARTINEVYPPITKTSKPVSVMQPKQAMIAGNLSVELNKVDIKQAIKIILGDILKLNYVLHPNVQGLVTLKTVRPITKKQMLGLVDTLLEAHGFSAVHGDGIVTIIPFSGEIAAKARHLIKNADQGFGAEVIPLKNVSTIQMLKLLTPVIEKNEAIGLPGINNLLILSGTKNQRKTLKTFIDLLDVDTIAAQHVAIISLRNTKPDIIIAELKQVLNAGANGLIRFTPVKRINALMAIAPNQKLIDDVNLWVKRLDRTQDADQRRLFVYFVKHSEAAALTETLKGAFSGSIMSSKRSSEKTDDTKSDKQTQNPLRPNFNPDLASNSILVWATGREYELISEVLLKLDIPPLQVLIEGTVLEVTLQDNLRYGFKYLIESGNFQSLFTQSSATVVSTVLPGFGATFGTQNNTKAVIDALSEITEVRVVSSPQLLVMDGGTARLHVGDQVPIVTRTSSTTATDDNRITNEIEYRDTGVTLDITPKVKSSGVVTLDISQTVSDVVRTSSSDINSPTIQQRQVVSKTSLQSGTTALLAGLIREVETDISSGIPLLHKIPFLGPLFGTSDEKKQRTELVVLITPKVMKNKTEAQTITQEILQKYNGLLNQNNRIKP
ncbi:MAG: type II secretion system secretin GspD [Alphaproteobacteria bacterium]|nr:type II secretion system secretin GspD [Alphaproteobacteria bacterium]